MPQSGFRYGFGCAALVLTLLLGPQPAQAAVDMGGKKTELVFSDKEIDTLMSLAGMESSISSVPSLITNAVTRAQPKLNDEQLLKLSQYVNDGRLAANLIESIHVSVRTQIDRDSYKKIAEWYASSTGKKLIAAEGYVATPDGQKALQESVGNAAAKAIDFDRSQILRDLDVATRASATQKLILDDFLEMLVRVTKDAGALQRAQSGIVAAQRDVAEQTVYAMNFAYATVSDQDLRAYLAFYRTQEGQKWVGVMRGLTRNLWRLVNQATIDYLANFEVKKTP